MTRAKIIAIEKEWLVVKYDNKEKRIRRNSEFLLPLLQDHMLKINSFCSIRIKDEWCDGMVDDIFCDQNGEEWLSVIYGSGEHYLIQRSSSNLSRKRIRKVGKDHAAEEKDSVTKSKTDDEVVQQRPAREDVKEQGRNRAEEIELRMHPYLYPVRDGKMICKVCRRLSKEAGCCIIRPARSDPRWWNKITKIKNKLIWK